jgi:hypothetical protein
MPANTYTMRHHEVEVRYEVDITPGLVALTYTDASGQRNFRDDQIKTEDTGLGTLVSVAIEESVDVGGERFGFYQPDVDVPADGTAEFRTAGVYETFSGPDSVPHRPASYRSIELHGTAQNVIHPL